MVTGRARSWTLWIGGFIVALVILAALGVAFIYSGIYNVAATYPDSPAAAWALSTTMDRSVRHRAAGIKVPNLNDPAKIRAGLGHYKDDCVVCHGAPGVRMGEVGRALNPKPPKLTEAAGDWKNNELFWIIKNGVRMSGMPAWGVNDSDKDLWETTAFVRQLPKMTPAQYKALAAQKPEGRE